MESLFLRALTADPRDDAARGAYADWLEEQGLTTAQTKAQAMYLRSTAASQGLDLEGQLALEERLHKLAARLPEDWLALVSRAPIMNCPRARDASAERTPTPQALLCERRWEDLRAGPPQSRPNHFFDKPNCHRYCTACQQSVRFHGELLAAVAPLVYEGPAVVMDVQWVDSRGLPMQDSAPEALPRPPQRRKRRSAPGANRPFTRRRRKQNAG
jgi:uncharacterized protein (TIGR02996 family)